MWIASVATRALNESGCPICINQKVVTTNSLAITRPDLASQWNFEKNGSLTPYDVVAGSGKQVWWKCPEDVDHIWFTSIEKRDNGHGCPYCSNRKVSKSNCLATKNPELANEWHPTKNGKLTPYDVTAGSHKKVWWKCPEGDDHEWKVSIEKRVLRGDYCPICSNRKVALSNCLAVTHSQLASEWDTEKNDKLTPYDVVAGSGKQIWWKCLKNDEHIWKATVYSRVIGTGCPYCNLGWSLDNIRLFVRSLLPILDALTPAELYTIFQQNGLLNTMGQSRSFVKALVTGKFPKEEIEKFINNEPSLVDEFVGGSEQTLEDALDTISKVEVNEQELDDKELNDNDLPVIETKDVLRALDNPLITSSADEEAIEFLITSGTAKIWKQAFLDEKRALEEAESYNGGEYATQVKNTFLIQYKGARELEIPKGYSFRVNGETAYPNLMQRLVAYQVKDRKRVGNWSGTGAGKTLSAILASRVIDARLTVICCPNAVVKGWADNIHLIFPDSKAYVKTLQPGINQSDGGYHYLILNYEAFQQENSESLVKRFVDSHKVDFIVIDEIHYSKQRIAEDISERRRVITGMISMADEVNPGIHILGMSATPVINNLYEGKTLIYTHYIKNITDILKQEIEKDRWEVAFYIGDDKSGLNRFLNGNADVLIATSTIGTGVDGLQRVCNRLIVNVLPWTHAEFEQLKGRIYRQGQVSSVVDVIVPLTFAEVNGEKWSWCESRWKRIKFKKDISDAAVDGVVPEGHLRTPAQAYEDVMNWLKRLDEGKVNEIERRKVYIPLEDIEIQKRVRSFGDFSKMNARINSEKSFSTHKRFQDNSEEWETYHALYREARKDWLVVPYEEIINWCRERPSYVIGDFGCGEAKIAESLENTVFSFDHVAINDKVVTCDIAHVPLEDEVLDVAVFSLSLMGSNFTDYILEAHRCLKLDGRIFIVEATSRFHDIEEFKRGLEKLGFDNFKIEEKYKFTFIQALKSIKEANPMLLSF